MVKVAEACVNALLFPHLGDGEERVLEARDAAHVGERETNDFVGFRLGDDWHVSHSSAFDNVSIGLAKDLIAWPHSRVQSSVQLPVQPESGVALMTGSPVA